jgi:hypothetical protein
LGENKEKKNRTHMLNKKARLFNLTFLSPDAGFAFRSRDFLSALSRPAAHAAGALHGAFSLRARAPLQNLLLFSNIPCVK